MSRYQSTNTPAVSTEALGTILVGAVAFGAVYAMLERAEKLRKANAVKHQDKSNKSLTYHQRIEKVVEKAKTASEINPTTILLYEYLDVKSTASAGDVITATRKIINQFKPLLKKTEPIFKRLYALSDSDKDLSDDEFDEAGEVMTKAVSSVIKSGSVICGHTFTLEKTGMHTTEPDKGFGQDEAEVDSPARNQYDTLLKLAAELDELAGYAESFGIAEYNQNETEWIWNVHDILGNALNSLVVYIEKSLK